MENAPSRRLPWLRMIAAVLAALLLIAFFGALVGPKVPVHQNKNLYAWAEDLQAAQQNYSDPDRWKKIEAANTAIRTIGTNALPFVMADLRARVTIKVRVVNWLAPRARFLKLQPIKVEDRWRRAIRALEALGPIAKPCLPELIALTSKSSGYIESALMAIGPDAIPAFTNLLASSKFPQTGNLIAGFVNSVYSDRIKPEQAVVALPYLVRVFHSSDAHGAWYAAGAFGAVHQEPELCIPLLLEGMTSSNPTIREASVQSLGGFGDAASAHAQKLADMFDQTDPPTRRAICDTLANSHSAAGVAAPVLIRGLADSNDSIRVSAASGLGYLGHLETLPDETFPALINAVEDRNPIVRLMSVQSLGMIGFRGTNVLSAIQRACIDPDRAVRQTATNALKRLSF